jgi:hypothetical protein
MVAPIMMISISVRAPRLPIACDPWTRGKFSVHASEADVIRLVVLHQAAKAEGIGVKRVIFDPPFIPGYIRPSGVNSSEPTSLS